MFSSIRATLTRLGLEHLAAPPVRESNLPDIYAGEDDLEEEEPTRGGGAAVRELRIDEDIDADEPTGRHVFFGLRAGGQTDTGMRRRRNEDAVLLLEEQALYVVADGMGGHAGGAVASQLAIDAIANAFLEKSELSCVLTNVPIRGAELVQGFAAANEAIRSLASREPCLSEMGTTLVAIRFCPLKQRAYIGHVGDSRCYRVRDGSIEQVTRDHTLAELGITGRDAHRLSRAVGANGILEADLMVVEPHDGDIFLLCSDGLTKTLEDDMILGVLSTQPDPARAATELIELANGFGARDNVSAIVIHVENPTTQAIEVVARGDA